MYLEYIWYSLLQRNEEFDYQVPVYLLGQWSIYRKVNGLDKSNESSKPKQPQQITSIENVQW